MIKRSISADPDEDLESSLNISPETVCYVIIKAHEFDVKDVSTGDDAGSSSSDDRMMSVLEDHGDDPVLDELTSFISSLTEDQQIDLVALAWLGRDDNTIEDWPTLREQAARARFAWQADRGLSARDADARRLPRRRFVALRQILRVVRNEPPLSIPIGLSGLPDDRRVRLTRMFD